MKSLFYLIEFFLERGGERRLILMKIKSLLLNISNKKEYKKILQKDRISQNFYKKERIKYLIFHLVKDFAYKINF